MADIDYRLSSPDVVTTFFDTQMSLDVPAHLEFLDNPQVDYPAPTVTLLSPLSGSIASTDNVVLFTQEASGGTLEIVWVYARYTNLGKAPEVVYDRGIQSPYQGTAVTGSLTLTFSRIGGFPGDFTLIVLAMDAGGSYQYFSFPISVSLASSVTGDSTGFSPSLGSVVPPGRDIALNADGEIDLDAGGAYLTTEGDAVAQALNIALRMVLGEWFANLDVGMDYFGQILGVKAPNLGAIKQLYRAACLAIPGVSEVTDINLSVSGRVLSGSITVTTDFGELTVPLEEVL